MDGVEPEVLRILDWKEIGWDPNRNLPNAMLVR
jgi:hypothetical protein